MKTRDNARLADYGRAITGSSVRPETTPAIVQDYRDLIAKADAYHAAGNGVLARRYRRMAELLYVSMTRKAQAACGKETAQ